VPKAKGSDFHHDLEVTKKSLAVVTEFQKDLARLVQSLKQLDQLKKNILATKTAIDQVTKVAGEDWFRMEHTPLYGAVTEFLADPAVAKFLGAKVNPVVREKGEAEKDHEEGGDD
jgi:hypothetical protein